MRASPGLRFGLCAFAACAGTALIFFCFRPGYMSFDSLAQLTEARSRVFTDAHPPVMAAIWSLFDRWSPGPQGMLLFHNAMFWSGAALACYLCLRGTWTAAAAVLFFGLVPPAFGLLSTVWKDVGMGSSLLLATALLLHSDRTGSKGSLLGSTLPLLYALSVRHNAALAVLPLAIFAGILFGRLFFPHASLRAGLLAGLVLFGMLGLSATAMNRLLLKGSGTFHYQGFVLHDVVALSLAGPQLFIPQAFFPDGRQPSKEELREMYDPTNIVALYAGKQLKFSSDPQEMDQLRRAWLTAVLREPGAYLNHRWIMFKAQLGLGRQPVCLPYQGGIDENSLNIVWRPSKVNDEAMVYLSKFRETVLFRGWFYLLITFVLLAVSRTLPIRLQGPALALGASSLLYELAYFFVAPTCDFRFNWWTVLATVLLGLYVLPLSKLQYKLSRKKVS